MQTTSPPVPAPPKSRRRWYYIGGFLLLLFLTPVVVYIIAGWWGERQMAAIYAEIEAEDPTWKWADLVKEIEPRPGEENSAEQIEKVHRLLAIKAFVLGPKWESDANQRSLAYRNSHLNAEQIQMLRTALDGAHPEALTEARKLKDMPSGRFPIDPTANPFALKMDYIQHSRAIMQLLQEDARQRAEDRDYDGAVESCEALLNTARSLRNNPTLIGVLVRIAGHAISVAAIERTLGQGEASEESLKKLQELLEREVADDALYQGMRGERAIGQKVYELTREQKMSISNLQGSAPTNIGFVNRLIDGWLLSGYPEYLKMMGEQVKAAKLKDAERAEAFDKLNDKVRSRATSNILVRLMMPASHKVAEASQRSQAHLRSAAVAVAAERYRLKHGRWPGSMGELVNESLIKEAYNDPYDGKPLRWKRTATGVIVYSVGPDKTDDGGKLDRSNPRTVGSDMGFELWDPSLRRIAPPVIVDEPK